MDLGQINLLLNSECSYDNTGGSGCNSSKTATKVINYKFTFYRREVPRKQYMIMQEMLKCVLLI